jgi:hypothetical protein
MCLIVFQITPPQPSNSTPCGTLYFPTNQSSKPSRGVRLINKKTDLSYTYPTLSYWIQPRIQHPTRALQYTVSPACPPSYVISSKITGHADIYNSSTHKPTPEQKHRMSGAFQVLLNEHSFMPADNFKRLNNAFQIALSIDRKIKQCHQNACISIK